MKNRKWYIAALLTLLQPGLGHMYCGRLSRGLALLGSLYLILIIQSPMKAFYTFSGMLVVMACFFSMYLYIVFDSIRIARSGPSTMKRYNKTINYIIMLIASAIIWNVIDANRNLLFGPVEYFNMPSLSMQETLHAGDRFSSDMDAYTGRAPIPGDLVVVLSPEDPTIIYVRRIVGTPGDVVRYFRKSLFVNDVRYDLLAHAPQGSDTIDIEKDVRIVLKENEYFVLGDNPQKALDSRWLGPVKRSDIIGKPLYIYWSSTLFRIGKSL